MPLPTAGEELHEHLAALATSDPDAAEFVFESMAMRGLAARLVAGRRQARDFVGSAGDSPDPSTEVADQQEADIFDFCCSALSALNCSFLLAYGIGHELNVSLPWGRALRQYPRDVESQFRQYFPKETVTSVMTAILTSEELAHLQGMRNALEHRGAMQRGLAVPGPGNGLTLTLTEDDLDSTLPTSSPPSLEIDLVSRTSELSEWLERSLDELISATLNDLVSKR